MIREGNKDRKARVNLYSGIYIDKAKNQAIESMVIAGYMYTDQKGIDIRFCKRASRSIYLKETENMTKSYSESTPYVFSLVPGRIPVIINLIKEIYTRRPIYMLVQDIHGNVVDSITGAGLAVINEKDPKKVEIINAFFGYPAMKVISKAE